MENTVLHHFPQSRFHFSGGEFRAMERIDFKRFGETVPAIAVALRVDHNHHRTQERFSPAEDIHQEMPGDAQEEEGFLPQQAGVHLGLKLAEQAHGVRSRNRETIGSGTAAVFLKIAVRIFEWPVLFCNSSKKMPAAIMAGFFAEKNDRTGLNLILS
jgi:hypothetical protein